jgi:hypothetical protein
MDRRRFLTTTGLGTLGITATGASTAGQPPPAIPPPTGADDRKYWAGVMQRLADPVLTHLSHGTLRARMPVEQAAGAGRAAVTHLEAFGRLVSGLAPWVELGPDASDEGRTRGRLAELTRAALATALDPASPDALNFTNERQPLVDAAFLAQGLLRAPTHLREALDAGTRARLVAALESTRVIPPYFSNWLLFSATVEAALRSLGASWDRMRVDYALRQHEQWYRGDGTYGDGPSFHWDYYNSFVIHPMLVDVLAACADEVPHWAEMRGRVETRARRYAAVLERLVAPDGSFPAIGRSLAYRCGAFHALAQAALRRALPEEVPPAQARGALTAVIRRTLNAPGTFDADGWLRIGLCGHQPGIGERYISTGSLYLCATGLLPLGLPATDEFWSAAPAPWTAVRAWSGAAFPIDHAIEG